MSTVDELEHSLSMNRTLKGKQIGENIACSWSSKPTKVDGEQKVLNTYVMSLCIVYVQLYMCTCVHVFQENSQSRNGIPKESITTSKIRINQEGLVKKEISKTDRCNHHRNTQYNQCFSRSLHASGVEEHARNGFRLRKVAQWVLVLLLQLLPCRKLRGREDRQRRTTGGQRDWLENIARCSNECQAADFLADQVKRKSIGGSRRQSQAEDVISGGICPY